MSFLSLLINLMHPCWIKVLISKLEQYLYSLQSMITPFSRLMKKAILVLLHWIISHMGRIFILEKHPFKESTKQQSDTIQLPWINFIGILIKMTDTPGCDLESNVTEINDDTHTHTHTHTTRFTHLPSTACDFCCTKVSWFTCFSFSITYELLNGDRMDYWELI